MNGKKYFGTDGIRGEVGSELVNAEFMLKLGWAAGRVLARKGKPVVLIGKDTRVSGYMLENALTAGLTSAGMQVELLGPMPTPAIAYLTHSVRASAGIVISASHNSYQDNGIKFFDENGYKLSDKLEYEIEALIDAPMQTVPSVSLGKAHRMKDARGRYIEFCKSCFPTSLNLNGLKIIVDCANGATYDVGPRIFHELGADVKAINNQPDGFNINAECGSTDTRHLSRKVVENKADIGIALDGDGDRLILIDHTGKLVDGDQILCILALNGFNKEAAGVVGTLMSNLGLEQAFQKNNIPFERANVGDRYVLEELKKNHWVLGGEASGHIVNLLHTTTGDGIITALQILAVMKKENASLYNLKQVMQARPQILINVPLKNRYVENEKITQAVRAAEDALKGEGRVLLRPSGTEPVVRVMVEGNVEAEVRKVAESLAAKVQSSI